VQGIAGVIDLLGDETWWDSELLEVCRSNLKVDHYDDAIREGFICVECRLRELTGIRPGQEHDHGSQLVIRAFDENKTDFGRLIKRRGINGHSARYFIDGAFGLFRNYLAHNLAGNELENCVAMLRAVNLMLGIIEQGRATVDDLWYDVRNPEEVVSRGDAVKRVLCANYSALRRLLAIREESADHHQLVVEVIDNAFREYVGGLIHQENGPEVRTLIRDELLDMLASEDLTFRNGAAYSLQFFPDATVSEALCQVLNRTEDERDELIVTVIETLAAIGTPNGRTAIARLLLCEGVSTSVVSAAIEALYQMGYSTDSAEALISILTRETGWPDKKRAIRSLQEIDAREALSQLHRCLTNEHWQIQIAACKALERFAEPSSAQPLGEMLMGTTTQDIRRAAAQALGKIQSDQAWRYLEECQRIEAKKSEDPHHVPEEERKDQDLLKIISEAQTRRTRG